MPCSWLNSQWGQQSQTKRVSSGRRESFSRHTSLSVHRKRPWNIYFRYYQRFRASTLLQSIDRKLSASTCFPKRHGICCACSAILLALIVCISFHPFMRQVAVKISAKYEQPVPLRSLKYMASSPIDTVPETIRRYVDWHRTQRACLLNPLLCKSPYRRPSVLIWRCPNRDVYICAGIGDRVRGMQVALMVAILTQRMFFIQWPSEEYQLIDAMSPNIIDWRIPPPIKYSMSKLSWPMLNWFICNYPQRRTRCVPPRFLVPMPQFLPNINSSLPTLNAFTDDIVQRLSIFKDVYLACRLPVSVINAFLSNPYISPVVPDLVPQKVSSILLQRLLTGILFRPSVATATVIADTMTSDFLHAKGYIGIHGRTGVEFHENGERFDFYRRNMAGAVKHLLTCVEAVAKHSTQKVFLSSDSVTLKREFASRARSQNFDVKFIDAPAFHFGLDDSDKMLVHQGRHVRYKAFIDIFADVFMLSNATQIITTGSGFAHLAFWLGNASKMIIVPPENGTALCASEYFNNREGSVQPIIVEA